MAEGAVLPSSSGRPELRPLNVVHVVRHVGPGGGVSGVVAALREHMASTDVHVATLSLEDLPFLPEALARRLSRSVLLAVEVIYFSVAAPIALRRRFPPDRWVSVSHNDCLTGDIYVNHGLHRALLRPHGGAWRWRMLARNPLHVFLLARETLRHWLGTNSVVINFSKLAEEEMLRAYPRMRPAFEVIPNGVDLDAFHPKPGGSRFETGGQLTLLFVGHEFRRKGLEHVLRAMPLLDSSIRLVVVGGDRQQVRSAVDIARALGIEDRVDFAGPRTDVVSYYQAADLFILPSVQEAWPLVLLEAMACGVPCLSTPVSSIPEIIQDGVNGYLVPPDPATIAKAVERTVQDHTLLPRLKAGARETAEGFGWSAVAARYVGVCHAVDAMRRSQAV